MNSRIILAFGSALALAACSGSNQPVPAASTGPDGIVADATPPTVVASGSGSADAASASAGSTTASAGGTPFAMRGRWGLTANDCTLGRSDAKGLMTVAASSLKFYESMAELGNTASRSDTMLRGNFAYTGEGMAWKRDVTLTLAPGGKTLTKLETGQDAPAGPLTYTRCS